MSEASRTLHSSEIYRTHYFVETRGPMAHRGGLAAPGSRRPLLWRAAAFAGAVGLLAAAVLAWVGEGDAAPAAATHVVEVPMPPAASVPPGDSKAQARVAKPAAAPRRADGQP